MNEAGFARTLADLRSTRPPNSVQPTPLQGLTLDSDGLIPSSVLPSTTSVATTLPSSPSNGDETILTDSLTAPTYMWKLRYVSGASTYKWYFVGGFHKPIVVATGETSSSASYTDLSTAGPSFTVPNAGEYLVAAECQVTQSGSGGYQFFSVKIGSAATADANGVEIGIGANGKGCFSRIQEITCAASDVLKMQYKVSANTHTWSNRSLMVLPKRVS